MLRKLFLWHHRQMCEIQGCVVAMNQSATLLVYELKAETGQFEMSRFVEFDRPHTRIGGFGRIEADTDDEAIAQSLLLPLSGEPLGFRMWEFLDVEVRIFALRSTIRLDFLEHGFTRQWMLVDP